MCAGGYHNDQNGLGVIFKGEDPLKLLYTRQRHTLFMHHPISKAQHKCHYVIESKHCQVIL